MNKSELVNEMVIKTGLTKKDMEAAVKAFEETVTETLSRGDKVALTGFGTFEVTERKARVGRNPKTNEEIQIPETKAPKFKAGSKLKTAIKEA